MNFFRKQEERLAMRLILWQHGKNMPLPHSSDLARQAKKVVDEAHQIARERGSNVLTIIKELISDIKKG